LLLNIKNTVKYYGERKILELKSFTLYAGDRVALTGRNGSGKTTLLKIIAGGMEPDRGSVEVKGVLKSIKQVDSGLGGEYDPDVAGKLGLKSPAHSGGELIKESIASAFSAKPDILLADEPTTNLDIAGIERLEEMLSGFRGGLILVSHDRALLKKICNRVLEIDRGTCRQYDCGYEEYQAQKELERASDEARYEQYAAEKDRIRKAAIEKSQKSAEVRRTPKRMGNSEARLHKMGGQKAKEKLDRSAKAALSRLENLGKMEKPWERKPITFDVKPGAIASPVLVRAEDVSKELGGRAILSHCSFIIPNNKKTALIGDNGAGKSTLLNMITEGAEGITKPPGLKTGYFRQDMSDIDDNKSVLDNALEDSIYDPSFSRTILARLLFGRDEIMNNAGTLSGGERIKLSIAKIILSDFNLLVLDEPTNYLDIESKEALESVLIAYPGAVLFVSHDREFIKNIADRVIVLKDGKAQTYEGIPEL
jgi:macrolide transport system ATP-binding/permease protein